MTRRFAVTISRQVTRRENFGTAMAAVNKENLQQYGRSHFRGMARKDRRNLARAYAATLWRLA